MAKYPEAHWLGPVPNRNPSGMLAHKGLVLHIQQGHEGGTNTVFHDPNFQASAHFGAAKDGHVDQWVDTDDEAWAEMAGNRYWISVEIEGFSGDHLTSEQEESIAKLYAWLHKTHGCPFQLAQAPDMSGLGFHAMGGSGWGGHLQCPGQPIIAARPALLHRARQIADFPAEHPVHGGPHKTPAPLPGGVPDGPAGPAWYHRPLSYDPLPRDAGQVTHGFQSGPDVKHVQRVVHVTEDGLFGSATKAKVRGFQFTHGLTIDGVVGPKTAAKMEAPHGK